MMILVNELYRKQVRNHKVLRTLSQLLMPFAPHIAEEIWSALGGQGFVSLAPWPEWVEDQIDLKECVIGVQVNGKTRSSIACSKSTLEMEAFKLAQKNLSVQNALKNRKVRKIIYKPGQILNIITS